uniref:Uncharacterized protein n=1 Tax=Cacopsylla melanoneura TaxID=428564 RepID=A0A8D8S745_9HEMI
MTTLLSSEAATATSNHLGPHWILDGTAEGALYWRRKSAAEQSIILENIRRVKFKHDVQVVEFFKQEYEDQQDYNDEDNTTASSEFIECSFPCDVDSDSTSVLLSSLCVAVMFLVLTYQCLF